MGRFYRLILAVLLVSTGVAASCQEVAIFADNRSMVVQSHRVDGSWTVFKVGSGEMAVPSASVLRIVQEKTQGAPVQAYAPPSPSPSAPSPVAAPSPWRPEPPSQVRPPEPLPVQEAEADDEEDLGDEENEEVKEPEPVPPPPPNGQLGQPGQKLPPGKMPPQPVLPSIFNQPRPPGDTKE